MKKRFLLIFLLLISSKSIACLNGETKALKNGIYVYEDYRGIVPKGHNFFKNNYPRLIKELDSLYSATNDIDYLSDKGYVLVIQNKFKEALEIYLKIEKIKPNRYSTASNIGTIYELLGDNVKALNWISKAVKINPNSHNGSEWLHVKILRAKISGSNYINSNFLINTNFGEEYEPKNNMSHLERKALIKSLYYQLNERVSFIKTEDKIIGILLFELGNLAFMEKKYDEAKEIYEKSREYGYKNQLIKLRISSADWNSKESLYKNISNIKAINEYHKKLFVITLIAAIIIIVGLLIVIYRMKRKS
jgi:tetratricopeptide (TPR) repeat protein